MNLEKEKGKYRAKNSTNDNMLLPAVALSPEVIFKKIL